MDQTEVHNMSYGKALDILGHLDTEEYPRPEIVNAIRKLLSMETINACTKETLRKTVKWLFEKY